MYFKSHFKQILSLGKSQAWALEKIFLLIIIANNPQSTACPSSLMLLLLPSLPLYTHLLHCKPMRQFNKVPGDADTAGPGITFLDFLNLFFIWWKIAFQFCVGFCFTRIWISHNYTYICIILYPFPPEPPSPFPTHPSTECQAGLPVLFSILPHHSVYRSMLLSQFVPCCVHKSVLY